jgi:hypothetical protein
MAEMRISVAPKWIDGDQRLEKINGSTDIAIERQLNVSTNLWRTSRRI